MRYLVLLLGVSLFACSGDKTGPPQEDLGRVGDSAVLSDGARTDGPVSITEGGPVSDGPATDGPVVSPDASVLMTDRTEGELTSGATRSTGGNYVLHSQVGHVVRPVILSGGNYTLRFNAAVIPW